eukprot:56569-Pleurochrysis_carterae.AAC.3
MEEKKPMLLVWMYGGGADDEDDDPDAAMDRTQEAFLGDILIDDVLGEVRLIFGNADDKLFEIEVLASGKKKIRAKGCMLAKGDDYNAPHAGGA